MRPSLFTFDIFGTVVDWRLGIESALGGAGLTAREADFDRIIDAQGAAEQRDPGRRYADIVADSLVSVLGVDRARATQTGAHAGSWPLFADSAEGMWRLLELAPCAAMTNSDRVHQGQVEEQLGFHLTHWFAAEEIGCYKPSREFWDRVAARLGRPFGADWWHVSAYADYDLEVARSLGLTTVLVERPHCRPGPAAHVARDLREVAALAVL